MRRTGLSIPSPVRIRSPSTGRLAKPPLWRGSVPITWYANVILPAPDAVTRGGAAFPRRSPFTPRGTADSGPVRTYRALNPYTTREIHFELFDSSVSPASL